MLPTEQKAEIATARRQSSQKALANMAVFPMIMLAGYIVLILYFKSARRVPTGSPRRPDQREPIPSVGPGHRRRQGGDEY